MRDLRSWIAKRLPQWRRGHTVHVYDELYVPEHIAACLFNERQQLVRKLAKERTRRRQAEHKLHERGSVIAQCNALITSWRDRAIAHGYTDEYVERERAAAGVQPVQAPRTCENCKDEAGGALTGWTCRSCGHVVPAGVEPTRQYLHPTRVDALIAVLEGECDGLAVTRETAEAILHYIDGNAPPAGAGACDDARDAARWRFWKNWWMYSDEGAGQLPSAVAAMMDNLDLDEAMDAALGVLPTDGGKTE